MAFRTVVVLVLYVVGALRKRLDGANHAASTNTHPATPQCQVLASGFGLRHGCSYPQAMMPVPECASAAFDEACYEDLTGESVTTYTRDLRSSSDYFSMSRVVAEAEGGGWGVSVSTSLSHMKSSAVSKKSLAFFLGASGRSVKRIIRRPVAMKLTTAAKDLLRSNPREFLMRYGLKYIHSITYGGSFLGSLALNSERTKDDTAVQSFSTFSVSRGLFSASGSADFQREVSQSSSSVRVRSSAKWRGGSGISLHPGQSPFALYDAYQQWTDSWRAHPKPLLVTTRKWIDSAELQEIVNNMTQEDRDLFNTPDYSGSILTEIGEESAKISLMDASVTQALGWSETQADTAAVTCLEDLRRSVMAKSIRIEALDDADVVGIQNQYLQGDFSWFESAAFLERYEACISGVVVTTTTTTTKPKDSLLRGDSLKSNADRSQLISSNTYHQLRMQSDGNLVVYTAGRSIWDTKTSRKGTGPYELKLQGDGNLVIYDRKSKALWASGTNNAARLDMQDDGNAVLYDHFGRAVWSIW